MERGISVPLARCSHYQHSAVVVLAVCICLCISRISPTCRILTTQSAVCVYEGYNHVGKKNVKMRRHAIKERANDNDQRDFTQESSWGT